MNSFSNANGCIRLSAMLVALVIFLALPVRADVYTWTDANGVKHYSNEAPPEGQKTTRHDEVKHSSDQYQSWDEQRQSRQDKVLEDSRSEDLQNRHKVGSTPRKASHGRPGKVVMYSTPTCGVCIRTKRFFAKHRIAYTDYDITTDKKARKRFMELGGTGVPLIIVGETRMLGFNERLLRRLLAIK